MAELLYQNLRRRYRASGFCIESLGRAAGIGPESLARKLGGRSDWTLDDVYRVAEVLRIEPYDLMHYWPPRGLDRLAPRRRGREVTKEDEIGRQLLDAIRTALIDLES